MGQYKWSQMKRKGATDKAKILLKLNSSVFMNEYTF